MNAAGIARQQGFSLVASSQSHFNQDYLSHSLLGFQFKTSKYGAYGISVENFSVDYSGSSLSAETAIGFHQGIMLRSDRSSSFSIGYGIKYYNIDYGSSAGPSGDGSDGIKLGSLSTFGLDISFLGSLADRIRVGAKALNINSPTLGDANNSTRLPQRSQIGIAYSPYDLVWTTVSLNKSVGHPTHFSSGLSYEIQKNIKSVENQLLSTLLSGNLKQLAKLDNYKTVMTTYKGACYTGSNFVGMLTLGRVDA